MTRMCFQNTECGRPGRSNIQIGTGQENTTSRRCSHVAAPEDGRAPEKEPRMRRFPVLKTRPKDYRIPKRDTAPMFDIQNRSFIRQSAASGKAGGLTKVERLKAAWPFRQSSH